MAFDEGLAQRIREILADDPNVVEKKMFGGLAFMITRHMGIGVTGDDLMVRVGPDQYDQALQQPHVREMDFTGKALKGFVYVGKDSIQEDPDLEGWIRMARDFVETLPPK